ncbi:Na(+)-translocating NADH-quinone reductase subunit A [Marinicella meishanensis]|uniref:Na(+)-translocating NADH-quinone reductase subunit A n=1 Tax=Marinicella meishanensis TaxID=2873263 RepID=UPI001CBBDBE3|nr:Na(+)-translocating NADH-quinone reductase subunit A [Marinicella sp. NBU2979]
MYKIKKGLNIPITGAATGDVVEHRTQQVAVLGPDYLGMKPTMLVQEGDAVKRGQKLFEDKKNPGVYFTAPIAGEVVAVNRGDKRMLLSVVIARQGDAAETFATPDLNNCAREELVDLLVESGLWTSFRTRPYSKIPAIDSTPNSVFVTAVDTNPLAIDPVHVIESDRQAFEVGLQAVSRLTEGTTYLCTAADTGLQVATGQGVETVEFGGVHPAGLVGTHIHYLDPVNASKTVWHLHYQDVMAIGRLLQTGQLDLTRIIGVTGPAAAKPKLVKTDVGACLQELLEDQALSPDKRVINGNVLNGSFVVEGTEYLGKYALQVAILEEGHRKELIGWLMPGSNKFSVTNAFIGGITQKLQKLTTSSGGSPRSMVPIGVYERVMPLDILPTLLLKAIIMKDTDAAQELGVLELDEEDLALCTFVCPSKYEFGAILRENLDKIEREG